MNVDETKNVKKNYWNFFPYCIVVSFSLGDWDLRKGIVQGKRDRVIRYLDKAFEDVALQIREKQARGENVTQARPNTNLQIKVLLS